MRATSGPGEIDRRRVRCASLDAAPAHRRYSHSMAPTKKRRNRLKAVPPSLGDERGCQAAAKSAEPDRRRRHADRR
jgi:hypothetical protein